MDTPKGHKNNQLLFFFFFSDSLFCLALSDSKGSTQGWVYLSLNPKSTNLLVR